MKLLVCSIVALICPSMQAMRAPAPRIARVKAPHARAYHNIAWPAGLPPFKVVVKPHLEKYVQPIISKLDDNEKYYYRQRHAAIQFWAIDGKFDCAAEQLATCYDATKSLILDQVDENGQTLLIKAAKAGYHDFMGFLLQQQANAAVADNEGLTALSINPTRLTRLLAHLLLENGADVSHADIHKREALHYLAMRQTIGRGQLQDITPRMVYKYLPDFSIYEKTNGELARMFISQGANMDACDIAGKTPINYAQNTEHVEVLKAFIDYGANRDAIIEKASDFVKQELIDHCKLY